MTTISTETSNAAGGGVGGGAGVASNIVTVAGRSYDMAGAANANIRLQAEGTCSDAEVTYYYDRIMEAIIRSNDLRNVTEAFKTQIFYALLLDHALVGTSSNRQFDNTVTVGNRTLKLHALKTAYNGMCRRFAKTHFPLAVSLLLLPNNSEIALDILRKGGMNATHLASIGSLLDFAPAQKMDTTAEQSKRLITFDANVYESVDPYASIRPVENRVAPGQLPPSAGGLPRTLM